MREFFRWALTVALVTAAAVALRPARAAAAEKTIDDLAKDGYLGEEDTWPQHQKLLGTAAPDLELSGWINGAVSREDMKGKILVLDFWATWCGPCKRAIPHNNAVQKAFKDKGVLVIGCCGGGQEENMAQVVQDTKMEYPTAKVSDKSAKDWAVLWYPHYVIVDRKGNIRAIGIKPDAVEPILTLLVAEQPAADK